MFTYVHKCCHIVKISPNHGGHVFVSSQHFLKESKKGSPKKQSYQIIMESIRHYGEEDFLKISLYVYSETKPRPRRPCFCRIKMSSRNLKEVHPSNILTKLQWNPLSHFGEMFLVVFPFGCHGSRLKNIRFYE